MKRKIITICKKIIKKLSKENEINNIAITKYEDVMQLVIKSNKFDIVLKTEFDKRNVHLLEHFRNQINDSIKFINTEL